MKSAVLSLALGSLAYFITIQNVELQNASGAWVSVIRPDKQVDLESTEAAVSFFNNPERVPAGDYNNFKVTVFLNETGAVKSLSAARPLEKPLTVKKGSFIRVGFDLETAPAAQAKSAQVTVDTDTRKLEDLKWS